AQFAGLSMDAAVDRLIHFPDTSRVASPPQLVDDHPRRRLAQPVATQPMQTQNDPLGLSNAMTAQNAPQMQMQQAAPTAEQIKALGKAHFDNAVALMQWWIGRMIASPAPLQEKMTLFWHGHFTSAYEGKGISAQDIFAQNQLYRSYALGNIRALALAVSHDPAMLKYLDNRANRAQHPNENYARELMELFTLGIGNYTEQDVRESARAFTGYTLDADDQFVFNQRIHDSGAKTFLGRTGNFTGDDIVNIIFQQSAASQFFARELVAFYVYSDPEPQLVDAVAALLRKNDYNLAPVMSTLLRSNVFYSDRAYRALVKSPTEFIVGSYKLLGMPVDAVDPPALAAMSRMGQRLFYPPNVKGWDGGATWLNSGTLLTRENFAGALCASPQMLQNATWLTQAVTLDSKTLAGRIVDQVLQGDISPASRAHLEAYLNGVDSSALGMLSGENLDERARGAVYLAMATPAYQLT
ncbi:MAG: DUF1800 domain-containing protein, partial [Candidatus Eremiobacteraeota bacterium]|nr:DUF1800 domain-containing protein [Candidatus Eremiobacteraeota bacterium]